jgi:predicted aspartyl protease
MNLSFRYKKVSSQMYRPVIPLQFSLKDGTPVTVAGLLDSGSDVMLMPHDVADSLELDAGKKTDEIDGVGGRVKVAKATARVVLDDGKRTYRIPHPLQVNVQLSGNMFDDVLIGRIPFFQEFIVEFNENARRVRLRPSHRH